MSYFATMRDGIAAHKDNGGHFFDPLTMRFFRSRVGRRIYGGQYFVTSERDGFSLNPRRYTVRKFTGPDGDVETVGEFQQYASRSGAIAAAKRYAIKGERS